MKIDITKIENYESLSAEDKVKLLEAYEFEEKKDDSAEYKKLLSDRNSEIKKLKDEIKSKLSEDERKKAEADEELAKLREQVEVFQKQTKIANYKANYIALGYNEDLATKRATFLADGDIENAMAIEREFLELHDKEIVAKNIRDTKTPASGSTAKTISREEFKRLGFSEMLKLKNEHPDLYKELTS